ncbi:uncharacterized protein Fot_55099 [Forsythia ovata]|uniref:Uncharacterized protein n=1 Tax=Forsythia ovata TaxID=205694 RepID=A0ABD1P5C5_9LAMI
MVDIYETASYCTLEELDRRNGTNWALNLGFPAQNIETCTEEWKKTSPALNLEDTNKESAVYIDSDGTKLRILLKFNDLQTFSNINGDSEPMKLVKRDRERKNPLNKKKKIFSKNTGGGTGQLSGGRKSISRTSSHSGAARAFGGLKYP